LSTKADEGQQRPDQRKRVLFALMLTLALAAMDATIVATAVPSIVQDLGGFSLFPWMFSIYLLLQAVSTPIYGKLSDQYGRKPLIMAGAVIFLTGSLLCGLAWSMVALIAFRGIQGLGAGAIQPLTQTIVGDLYSVRERASIQGYIASVWGVSAIIGPAIGGVLSQYASWHWLFFVNIPVGLVGLYMLARHYDESVRRIETRIDYAGAALLMSGLSLVILVLLQATAWGWTSTPAILVAAAGALLLGAFVVIERRADEPILPFWVFRTRPLLAANLGTLGLGMIMMALTTYLPVFAQEVMRQPPVVAAFTLASMSIGWPLASSLSGRLYLRIGFRNTAILGLSIAGLSGLLFLQLTATSSPLQAAASSFVTGCGLGLSNTSFIVGIQSLVGRQRRGTATGSNMFARLIGGAVGVAIYGSIVNSTLATRLAGARDDIAARLDSTTAITSALREGVRLPTGARELVRDGLFVGIHRVFIGIVVAALLALAVQLTVVKGSHYRRDDLSGAEH
jgi:EmrB/QacA subfamily drug resistance transporter